MQDLISKLKRLQSITPDPDYTRHSRSLLIKTPIAPKSLSLWRVVVTSFQSGSVIALTAILLLVILGGFSAWQAISPFRLGSLDPASLRAEAEAIDMQIELTNLVYPEVQKTATPESTAKVVKTAPAPVSTEETVSTTTEEVVGIDEALEILSK
jgi:hypothetical protein